MKPPSVTQQKSLKNILNHTKIDPFSEGSFFSFYLIFTAIIILLSCYTFVSEKWWMIAYEYD